MGPFHIYFRRRIALRRGRHDETWINLSKTGASVSERVGKRLTVNTRGGVAIRIMKGLSIRSRGRR